MKPEELLLRDIHLPDPVPWWPPAIGWWLLAAVIIGLAILIAWWRQRRMAKRKAPETLARRELDRLRSAWTAHRDTQRLVVELSTWLRRSGMSLTSRHHAASPTGAQWHACLDGIAGEPLFDDENGALISAAPYRPDAGQVDAEELLGLCERWLAAASARARPS